MAAASEHVTRTELADQTAILRSAQGVLVFKHEGGVLFIASTGTLNQPMMKALTDAMDSTLAVQVRPLMVAHALDQQGYTPEAREYMTAWAKKASPKVRALILMRSKIVRMVVSVVAMFTKAELEIFSDEAAFGVAVSKALPSGLRDPHLERHFTAR